MITFETNLGFRGDVSIDELSLFTRALGIAKPWRVVDLKFSKEQGRLDLWLDFLKGAKFLCPSYDETWKGEVHDTQDRT
jgi:transposase